jgi:hypothetical protein
VKLTRRDALAALSAAGVAVGGAVVADRAVDGETLGDSLDGDLLGSDGELGDDGSADPLDESARQTFVAVAEVVYPSELDGIEGFVETYTEGRLLADESRRRSVATTLSELDEVSREWESTAFTNLDTDTRDELLRELAVDTADPDPEGLLPGRVRYYVVNDLLYALYASPTGGELAGTPNPIGHPGGYRTQLSPEYQRASPAETRDPTAETRDPTAETRDPTAETRDPTAETRDPTAGGDSDGTANNDRTTDADGGEADG